MQWLYCETAKRRCVLFFRNLLCERKDREKMANTVRSARTMMKPLTAAALHEMPKFKQRVKAQLPSLRAKDIRRYKLPHSQIVVLELREDGHVEAAEYFEFLFRLDENIKTAAGPDTVIWNNPRLKDNEELVDQLRQVLVSVFDEKLPAETRTTLTIKMSLRVENSKWEWWWIADTLYRTALQIAKEIDSNDREIVNSLRFLYARFLFSKLKKPDLALEHVKMAQKESRGQPWNASKLLDCRQESLFTESCVLMHKVLVSIAREERENDAEVAVNSCKVALDCACESWRKELVAEAHYELAESERAAGNLSGAVEHFFASLGILEEVDDPVGICRVHSKLASTYERIGDGEKVLEHFRKLKDVASECGLPYKYAEAHYFTGEYHLRRNDPEKATANFQVAFAVYNRLGAKNDANRARCFLGISKGQQIMDKYKALIEQSVEGVSDALLKIILWKDRGEPFD
ncbi:tetratricopeptide repeat protein 29-like [Copidosoma floridanum]|uniref:tetratricopeptide repeat protein 29-like n=1 Tax=Copidosoma floridanum TaxID=29053 RepID=UPI0006C96A01|nr:tetratricopeptide repeat protein 29-like [Copidosoma floridanum]